MTSYNLKPITTPNIEVQEAKEKRRKVLEAVRERREKIYKRFSEKMQLQADNNT